MRFVQSKACPAILAVFFGGVGIKLTMSGEPPWGAVPESPPGTEFNANWKHWEPIDMSRLYDAMEAWEKVRHA